MGGTSNLFAADTMFPRERFNTSTPTAFCHFTESYTIFNAQSVNVVVLKVHANEQRHPVWHIFAHDFKGTQGNFALFSNEPPYSSLRWLNAGDKKRVKKILMCTMHLDKVKILLQQLDELLRQRRCELRECLQGSWHHGNKHSSITVKANTQAALMAVCRIYRRPHV